MATTDSPWGEAAYHRPLHAVALVKQVPLGDHPGDLDGSGRLRRDGFPVELNPWCRRAVTRAVQLGRGSGGRTTVVTMGPPAAADVLREALACGADEGLHVCDPALAGADTLVTAKALAAAVRSLGPVDLVLAGHSTLDGGTGAVGPMVAALLGLPFAGPALSIEAVGGDGLRAVLQLDAVTETAELALPAVLAVAERSCRPAKAPPAAWPAAPQIRVLTLDQLTGAQPGAASPTRVHRVERVAATRRPVLVSGSPAEQAAQAVALITARLAAADCSGRSSAVGAGTYAGTSGPGNPVADRPGPAAATGVAAAGVAASDVAVAGVAAPDPAAPSATAGEPGCTAITGRAADPYPAGLPGAAVLAVTGVTATGVAASDVAVAGVAAPDPAAPSATAGEPGRTAVTRRAADPYPAGLPGPAVLAVTGSPETGGRALLGEAARIARRIGGHVLAVTPAADPEQLRDWGADAALRLTGGDPRPVAAALAGRLRGSRAPWAVLGGASAWDREVLARLAVHQDAGLLSDLTTTSVRPDARGRLRLVGGKPSGNGTLAEVGSDGVPQIATLRTGSLTVRAGHADPVTSPARIAAPIPVETLHVPADPLLRRSDRRTEDDFDAVERAATVIGLGAGVAPDRYAEVEPLRALLGAEFAATRKVTDAGALPHCRQLGVTGRNIAPRLYVALGVSGSPHHLAGVERAHTVLAVNSDPDAAVFAHCDIGIVADWRDVLPALTAAFRRAPTAASAPEATAV
ncbi:FAD-binding protein [Streptomyces sp. NBC_00669]|uniref:FAD-binding protein n=1 Tax=Streptomyces sp. NBC_00669 TaxID=2976011 RepID=UPI002E30BA06|nr:FAD-binding protein [Streptomyces sp. NBC_00669]